MDFGNSDNNVVKPKGFNIGEGAILWTLVIAFFAAVIYMIIGKGIPMPPNPIPYLVPKSMRVYSVSKLVWPPSGNTTQLTAYPSQFGELQDNSYSFNMDLVIKESRTNDTTGVHRHIFHRGSNEETTELPKRMNPGVFLDPITNDLLIFVDTLGAESGYRESLRIADIPLTTPFRLGLVVNNRTLDVYINCRLEETMFLKGTPKTVENRLYGLTGANIAPAQLQNVYVWNYPLGADDVTAICGAAPSFALSPTCGLPPPRAPSIDAAGPPPVSITARGASEAAQSAINSIFNIGTNVYTG
jgi:hypothetical protein